LVPSEPTQVFALVCHGARLVLAVNLTAQSKF
jgi:hypothetical protein